MDLFAETNIDGALIEGASLDATEFTAIYTAAHRAVQKAIAAST
ncbi:triose-phosphate isomerase [Trinickia terrae]